MWTAFRVAALGAQAQERALEVSANNLANVQTTGFKARRASLAEVPPGTSVFSTQSPLGGITLVTEGVGQGATLGAVLTTTAQGTALITGRALDLSINGEGFLAVSLPDGQLAYTRDGSLHLDGQRRVVTGGGLVLAPGITLPEGVTNVSISADGTVTTRAGSGPWQIVGRLELVRFPNPDGLVSIGRNLFAASESAGAAVSATSGARGFGIIEQGKLEASNVDVAEELTRVVRAQRAYQANLRALRVVDEMVQEANTVR